MASVQGWSNSGSIRDEQVFHVEKVAQARAWSENGASVLAALEGA